MTSQDEDKTLRTDGASGDAAVSSALVDFDFSGEISTRTLVDRSRADETFVSSGPDSKTRTAPTANHVALPLGYQLHEFTIESLLGTGGFGITYLARDNNLQTQVAIKEYLPHDLAIRTEGQTVCPRSDEWNKDYQTGLERFLAESRVLAGFRHANIVRITRFFEANRTAYMVMDYERGQPLRDWLLHHSPVSEDTLLKMFVPLLEGLEVVHKAGVLHRDIKPANIYVRETDGSLVLLDFGAARQTSGNASRSLTSIVTPGYAPFEQYHTRGAQGPWSDLYALGGVLYWLTTGQKPIEAPSRMKQDVLTPAVTAAAGRFSPHFLAAIDWALRPDEEQRPRSVAEFKAALTGVAPVPDLPSQPVAPAAPAAAPPPMPAEADAPVVAKKGKGAIYAAIGAVVVLALAGIGLMQKPAPAASESSAGAAAPSSAAAAATTPAVPETPAAATTSGKTSKASGAPAAKTAPPTKATGVVASTAKAADKPAADTAALSATVSFEILPYGDIYENNRKLGTSPPLRQLKVAPGKHKFEIRGDRKPFYAYHTVDVKAGETQKVWVKFDD
jgi:serine/threonine protein kinase